MRHILAALVLACSCACSSVRHPAPGPGPLVIVGGGGTTDAIAEELFRLAGGKDARMLMVPWASENPAQGEELVQFWKEKGATDAEAISEDPVVARRQLEQARIVWMGGGDQKQLFDKLKRLGLDADIERRHREGAVVGGTSAGAAVQSKAMMVGGDTADMDTVKAGGTLIVEGLELVDAAVIDQHFLKRRRFARLLSAVLDRPELLGIGIDERTAAIVQGTRIAVAGEGQVLVVDARRATVGACEPGKRHSAVGMRLDLLRAGDTLDWDDR